MLSLTTHLHRLRFRLALARDCRFDKRHGVDTDGLMIQPDMRGLGRTVKACANPYHATPGSVFRRILRSAGICPSNFTFIDLGCGKGRTLLLASLHPFREILGIEADPVFAQQARANVEAWKAGRRGGAAPIRVVEEDASCFKPPAGNLFIYMYNPFHGAVFEVIASRLAAIAREPGRIVVIAYYNDFEGGMLDRTGAFVRRRLRPRRFWARPVISYFSNV